MRKKLNQFAFKLTNNLMTHTIKYLQPFLTITLQLLDLERLGDAFWISSNFGSNRVIISLYFKLHIKIDYIIALICYRINFVLINQNRSTVVRDLDTALSRQQLRLEESLHHCGNMDLRTDFLDTRFRLGSHP